MQYPCKKQTRDHGNSRGLLLDKVGYHVCYLPITCPAYAGVQPFNFSFVNHFTYTFENGLRCSKYAV